MRSLEQKNPRESNTRNFPNKTQTQQRRETNVRGQKVLTDRRIQIIILLTAVIGVGFELYDHFHHDDPFLKGTIIPAPVPATTNENASQGFELLDSKPMFSKTPPQPKEPKILGILLDSISQVINPSIDKVILNGGTWFSFGKFHVKITYQELETGVEFRLPLDDEYSRRLHPDCPKSRVRFGVRNGRLFVAAEFFDLQNEQFIGSINYDRWKLYKPNLLSFYNDDKTLEVRDKQNKIVFSLLYDVQKPNEIPLLHLGGYFINTKAVIVVPNAKRIDGDSRDCYCFLKTDPSWKTQAAEKIDSLISVVPQTQ